MKLVSLSQLCKLWGINGYWNITMFSYYSLLRREQKVLRIQYYHHHYHYLISSLTLRCFNKVMKVICQLRETTLFSAYSVPPMQSYCQLSLRHLASLEIVLSAPTTEGTTWADAWYISFFSLVRFWYHCIFTCSTFWCSYSKVLQHLSGSIPGWSCAQVWYDDHYCIKYYHYIFIQ